MRMAPLPTLLFALSTLSTLSACPREGSSLAGYWSGDVDCGEGTVPIDIELYLDGSASARRYFGDGTLSWTNGAGEYWQIDFETVVEHDAIGLEDDRVALDVDTSECEEIDLGELDCGDVEADWEIRDGRIVGELELFEDWCDFEMD